MQKLGFTYGWLHLDIKFPLNIWKDFGKYGIKGRELRRAWSEKSAAKYDKNLKPAIDVNSVRAKSFNISSSDADLRANKNKFCGSSLNAFYNVR